tara:strand:- start:687 stop:809 length:123 start_codon:yes stop_codon:yes gene_type:complete
MWALRWLNAGPNWAAVKAFSQHILVTDKKLIVILSKFGCF